MKTMIKLLLGLLILTPALYASEHTEDDAKRLAAHGVADDEEEVPLDPERAGFAQLAKQTPEQTEQAGKLEIAVQYNNIKEVKKLLDAKADVNALTWDRRPIIRSAFDYEILKLLLDHKAQVNVKDSEGTTILHWICFVNGETDKYAIEKCLLLLFNKGAKINVQNKKGSTPLHYCVPTFSNPKIEPKYVTLLLEYGADPTIVRLADFNSSRQTCLDILCEELHYSDTILRVPACKMILALDQHRKQIDAIKSALDENHAYAFNNGVDGIVLEYTCGKHGASKEKLEAIFKEFDGLFKQLRESKQLS